MAWVPRRSGCPSFLVLAMYPWMRPRLATAAASIIMALSRKCPRTGSLPLPKGCFAENTLASTDACRLCLLWQARALCFRRNVALTSRCLRYKARLSWHLSCRAEQRSVTDTALHVHRTGPALLAHKVSHVAISPATGLDGYSLSLWTSEMSRCAIARGLDAEISQSHPIGSESTALNGRLNVF